MTSSRTPRPRPLTAVATAAAVFAARSGGFRHSTRVPERGPVSDGAIGSCGSRLVGGDERAGVESSAVVSIFAVGAVPGGGRGTRVTGARTAQIANTTTRTTTVHIRHNGARP